MPQTHTMEVDADEAASTEVVDLEGGEVEAEDIGREEEDVVMEEDNKSKRKPPLLSLNLARNVTMRSTARKHAQQRGRWLQHKQQLTTPTTK